MKIEAAVKDYLVDIEIRKYTKKTLTITKSRLKDFTEFLREGLEIGDCDDITPNALKRYTQHSMQRGLKGSTINGNLKTIKSFIQYCYEEDFGGYDTRKHRFKWVKEEKPVITAFSIRDVRKMLDSCRGFGFYEIRDAAILTTLFETGIRCQELYSIKVKDIHDDYIIINGKNHKQRVVPITPVLKKAMMRYDRVRESYFEGKNTEDNYFLSYTGRALTNNAITYILQKRGKGISGVRVSPHTCRHFFAQQQIRMGTDIYTISRLLGHENISITQIYLNSLKDEDIIKIAKSNSVLMSMK